MHAIWKGTISFGLVTIPVKVYSATEERDISFRQVHEADGGRIRYKRVCEQDGQEVPYSDIGKGYELPDGRMVILTSEDFASLPLPTTRAIDVLEFVPADQVDPLYFAKAYYLAADGVGAKPYILLRDALTRSGQCALVKVAIRTRETLALLREREGALVLQTMLWPEEVRDSEFAVPDDSVEVRSQEAKMAESYIATLKSDFDPTRYHSDYREALEQLVEAKASGLPMPEGEEDDAQQADVLDLVAALRASVDAAKKRRAGGSESSSDGDGDSDSTEAPSRASGSNGKAPAPTSTTGKKSGSGTRKSASKSASDDSDAKKASSTPKPAAKKRPARKSA
ncbi:MAG TPA: Ku protein [Nocardioidaceae bacterium]|nr:Ku protein [Nocardioidaceae bacterium]